MRTRFLFLLLVVKLFSQGCVTYNPEHITTGPAKGTLIIVGGGGMPRVIFDRFFKAAGGRDAKIVVVPVRISSKALNTGLFVTIQNLMTSR